MNVFAKAVYAFVSAGVGSLAVAAADNGITMSEGLIAAAAALVAFGGVYGIKNAVGSPPV